MMPAVPIAIVVPAYRSRYLGETLAAFANQTDRRFRLYVADDGSPELLARIVEPFAGRIDLVYRRFSENFGRDRLGQHWERAIRLSTEPWVWLFSDDDLAAPDCVAALLGHLAASRETPGLLRFDLEFIDAAGTLLRREATFPTRLTAEEYAYRLLSQPRESCVIQNIVFRRAVFEAAGGFVDFPGGLGTDYATWPQLSRTGGVTRLRGGRVRFRIHAESLGSSYGSEAAARPDMIRAHARVVRELRKVAGAETAASSRWRRAELVWLGHWLSNLSRPLRADERAQLAGEMAVLWPERRVARSVFLWRNHFVCRLRLFTRAYPRSMRFFRGRCGLVRSRANQHSD